MKPTPIATPVKALEAIEVVMHHNHHLHLLQPHGGERSCMAVAITKSH